MKRQKTKRADVGASPLLLFFLLLKLAASGEDCERRLLFMHYIPSSKEQKSGCRISL